MPTALLSVSDKAGLVEFARGLVEAGYDLVASGGTALVLRDAGLPVRAVSELTGSPEILGGRVKTLHPAVHGGILSRRTEEDRDELAGPDWGEIDLVAVNLYPFEEGVFAGETPPDEAVELIDIGGVALLRAAAKNFAHVIVVSDPADYEGVLAGLAAGGVSLEMRRALAAKAFARTAAYDAAVHRYLGHGDHALPERFAAGGRRLLELRYGENSHQPAALYAPTGVEGPLGGELLGGKPLSYNNLLDLDAAWRAVSDFQAPTVVIVKHLSPTGIASAVSVAEAFPEALAGDPISAFGGVIAANRPFDGEAAEALGKLFVEAIVAPAFTGEARDYLARKKKNCRLLAVTQVVDDALEVRSVRGGLLVQERDRGDEAEWRVVTERAPAEGELAALRFAWKAVAHVKSNAIVFAKGARLTGVGGGQPSRVDAVRIAAEKAGEDAPGSVMASDAFFPFPDGVEVAAAAGVTAVVQPGGSIRDELVIDAANRLGLAMVFTGYRHFRH